jgi:hypothetical protein
MTRCISHPKFVDELSYGFITPFGDEEVDDSSKRYTASSYTGMDNRVTNSTYLQQGQYKIEFLYNNSLGSVMSQVELMDFPTSTQCIIREGQELYMLIDRESLADLTKLGIGPYTRNATDIQNIQGIKSGKCWAFLKVFYVLGGTQPSISSTALVNATINIGIAVNDEVGKSSVYIMRARVFSDCTISSLETTDACQRITVRPRQDGVVYDRAMRVKQKHGSSISATWVWKP